MAQQLIFNIADDAKAADIQTKFANLRSKEIKGIPSFDGTDDDGVTPITEAQYAKKHIANHLNKWYENLKVAADLETAEATARAAVGTGAITN